jgi:2-polyprenyl-6-methoxyphenol hydroxylase-like FAD-dependent oxidoreductase
MTPGRAIIVGGSIGGLFAALLLRRRGWAVRVFERVPTPLASRGAGIITHPQLRAVLETLGLDTVHDFGVAVAERITLARDGAVVGRYPCAQVATSWDRVFSMLRGALPDECYVMGAEFAGVEWTPDGVRVRFAGGRVETGTLLVGADGIRSAVRGALLPEAAPLYAGYAAWRGLLNEAAVPASLMDVFAFGLPPGEQVLGYPVAGEGNDLRPGRRRYNLVWYRPADERTGLAALLTDTEGVRHESSIPPTLIRPAVLADMRAAARALLAPVFAQVVEATPMPLLQPIFDLESPRIGFEQAALLGDAAFVARPHVGAGVTKAAEDAVCLAEALAAEPDLAAALRRYDAERCPASRRVVQRGRHLGSYLQAEQSSEERAAAARHQTVEAVMAETALLDW